ncbi:SRPBCC family protein [Pontibacter sp. G13]|uniref:SRPBCC family protein n=1 Tax=Pontibacter sp. G13 TaxID=3074898 RepID=UPI00288A7A36|nr:SRPBCC family protein [Pontibacter sp. G13]WNJ21335.1 SRPBCC family protein [Pontibacter sp. G13]
MKTLTRILLAIVLVVVVIYGIMALVIPTEKTVSRTAELNAPIRVVFEQVNTMSNWEKWSPWHQIDPNMKIEYANIPSGPGAAYSWESEDPNVGHGSLKIDESIPNESIHTTLHFEGQSSDGHGTWKFVEKGPDRTEVTWAMAMTFTKKPSDLMFAAMADMILGGTFEDGLENLEEVSQEAAEKQEIQEAAEVLEEDHEMMEEAEE